MRYNDPPVRRRALIFATVLLAMIASTIFIGPTTFAGGPNDVLEIAATGSSPAGSGTGQNWFVGSSVTPGGSFTVDIAVSIDGNGNTTSYPRTVNLGQAPGGDGTLGAIADCTFTSGALPCARTVTITAPATAGTYLIKVAATGGTGNTVGLNDGNGLNIHYDVAGGPPPCEPAATTLSVDNLEAIYHQPAVTLSATLTQTSDSTALAGKTIRFEVDGAPVGTGTTDSNGTATYSLDTNSLAVGDYTIDAFYDGEECIFEASSGSGSLCVSYGSVSFKPPISPTGPALFRSVRTIPVKVIITDYYGVSVPNADAHVFFAKYTSNTTTDVDSVADPLANTNGDNGNTMRYDATAGQYIFNWNTTGLSDGKYRIHIVLGEGSCTPERTADVTFKRK